VSNARNWREQAITLKTPVTELMSAMAMLRQQSDTSAFDKIKNKNKPGRTGPKGKEVTLDFNTTREL
jgi:hypothetical protein